MHGVDKSAAFIWSNMPFGDGRTLTPQQAFDVAAFVNYQPRPFDPRDGRLRKLIERIWHQLSGSPGRSSS
jgi:thiosulfate dehydrogenase